MSYQTINPYTEELVETFREHTDAELGAIIAKADEAFENDWSREIPRRAQRDTEEGGFDSAREARRVRKTHHS